MTIRIPRKTFTAALSRLQRTAGRVSLLDCVRLHYEPEGQALVLETTDGTAWTRVILECEGPTKGDAEDIAAVPIATFRAVVAASDGDVVEIDTCKNGVMVMDASGKTKLLSATMEHLPKIPRGDVAKAASMTIGRLGQAIQAVRFAVAKESSRYAIGGVCYEGSDVVATNGRILAVSHGLPAVEKPILMPQAFADAVVDLARMIPEEDCEILTGPSHVCVMTEDWEIGSCMVEGTFAPWRSVVPQKPGEISAELDVEACRRLLKAAMTCTSESSPGVRLIVQGENITIRGHDPSIGEAELSTPCSTVGYIEIGVNPKQMLAAIESAPAASVKACMTTAEKPIVMEAGDWHAVMMPLAMR
jgi:DNA polymerase III sliding clamp (beta) subunit (PCNA family)